MLAKYSIEMAKSQIISMIQITGKPLSEKKIKILITCQNYCFIK